MDTQIIFQTGIFLGVILLISSMGASEYIDLGGTEEFEELEPPEETRIDFQDPDEQQNVEIRPVDEVSDPEWNLIDRDYVINRDPEAPEYDPEDDSTWAFVRFNTGSNLQFDVFTTDEGIIFNSDNGISATFGRSGEQVNLAGSQQFTRNQPEDYIRIDFQENEDNRLYGLTIRERDEAGFLDTLRAVTQVFMLDTDTNWVMYLIVLPLAMVGVYLLVKNAGSYLPFT